MSSILAWALTGYGLYAILFSGSPEQGLVGVLALIYGAIFFNTAKIQRLENTFNGLVQAIQESEETAEEDAQQKKIDSLYGRD